MKKLFVKKPKHKYDGWFNSYDELQAFSAWLREHDAFEKYIANLIADDSDSFTNGAVTDIESAQTYLEGLEPEEYIDNAFYWSETPEGTQYWAELCTSWQEFVDENEYLFN